MLNISADISPGNSGGLAVNSAGTLVGVPSLIRDDKIPSMRPSEFTLPLIEAARKGKTYTSALYRPLTTEKVANVQIVAPNSVSGITFDCSTGAPAPLDVGAVGVSFTFEGFEVGEHQDLAVAVFSGENFLGLQTLESDYPVRWPSASGCATVTVPIDASKVTDPAAPLTLTIGVGPGYSTVP